MNEKLTLRDALPPEPVLRYRHIMIDLETLGNDYDGIFVTLGACGFNPYTGDIDHKFYTPINWESSVDAGRSITPATIKWWMKQEPEALQAILEEGPPLHHVLHQFSEWLPKDAIVWGNGSCFDIGKLENAFGYYNIPWAFWDIMDVRTIRRLSKGLVDRDTIPLTGTAHNALDDAVWQAKYVSAMHQALRPDLIGITEFEEADKKEID